MLKAMERLRNSQESYRGKQQFLAMYSSVYGGITTDPAAMVIPMDDHMVHRGHGVFDTAAIMDGSVIDSRFTIDSCFFRERCWILNCFMHSFPA